MVNYRNRHRKYYGGDEEDLINRELGEGNREPDILGEKTTEFNPMDTKYEREKQTLLHRLDGMTDEQRMAAKEQQKMGITNWFKTSGEENSAYRESERYQQDSDVERYDTMNQIFKQNDLNNLVMNIDTGEMNNMPAEPVMDPIDEEGEGGEDGGDDDIVDDADDEGDDDDGGDTEYDF